MNKKIKYGFDVDGVCLNFGLSFIEFCQTKGINLQIGKVWNFFDQDVRSYDVFKNLKSDFWLHLKREEKSLDLSVTPAAYISHRTCPTEVTKKCLMNAGFPDAPVLHVKYTEDKVKLAKELGIDVFIDDRASTVMYFLENGISAYTLDQLWNEDFNVPRIYTLGQLGKYEIDTEKFVEYRRGDKIRVKEEYLNEVRKFAEMSERNPDEAINKLKSLNRILNTYKQDNFYCAELVDENDMSNLHIRQSNNELKLQEDLKKYWEKI